MDAPSTQAIHQAAAVPFFYLDSAVDHGAYSNYFHRDFLNNLVHLITTPPMWLGFIMLADWIHKLVCLAVLKGAPLPRFSLGGVLAVAFFLLLAHVDPVCGLLFAPFLAASALLSQRWISPLKSITSYRFWRYLPASLFCEFVGSLQVVAHVHYEGTYHDVSMYEAYIVTPCVIVLQAINKYTPYRKQFCADIEQQQDSYSHFDIFHKVDWVPYYLMYVTAALVAGLYALEKRSTKTKRRVE